MHHDNLTFYFSTNVGAKFHEFLCIFWPSKMWLFCQNESHQVAAWARNIKKFNPEWHTFQHFNNWKHCRLALCVERCVMSTIHDESFHFFLLILPGLFSLAEDVYACHTSFHQFEHMISEDMISRYTSVVLAGAANSLRFAGVLWQVLLWVAENMSCDAVVGHDGCGNAIMQNETKSATEMLQQTCLRISNSDWILAAQNIICSGSGQFFFFYPNYFLPNISRILNC